MWSSIKNMFTGSITGLVSATGDAIDRLVTSDEERLALKNALKQIESDASNSANKHIENMEAQVTERHANDMKSDSWLSKNIRPLTMAFLTVMVVLMAFLTMFKPEMKTEILKMWIELFTYLMGLVYVFYFGSRGIEKIATIIKK